MVFLETDFLVALETSLSLKDQSTYTMHAML